MVNAGRMMSPDPAPGQLTLNVGLRDDATLDNFLPTTPLQPLLAALLGQAGADGEPVIFLHGAAGSGKSHLLQAACHQVGAGALYLPLEELGAQRPGEVLQGVDAMKLVCIDDLHLVAGDAEWERALFHFFNLARERGCRLLLSAKSAPRALALDLPDLRSRLAWGVVFQLPGQTDERRRAILEFRAGRRGMEMSREVSAYIVSRAPRGMGDLLQLLESLDAATLREQRVLSRPFVRQVLGW